MQVRTRQLVMMCTVVCMAQIAAAQISPGELSAPHASLEGIGNCTQCHSIGKEISNGNCLNCHTEIKSRMSAKKGFHASVGAKECVECHKEHHGRKFTIIRFDRTAFDHTLAGYPLDGKHAALKCEQCHTAGRITAKDVQSLTAERKERTFLGLGTACLSCHKDEHRGQLKTDCRQCHVTTAWKPAPKFSHENARFKLTGKHAQVECSHCHKRSSEEGGGTQFVRLEFGSCRSCHTDPHKGKFTQECAQCHTTVSWRQVQTASFDHQRTLFPLKGKHAAMKCEQCHPKDPKAKNPSGETGFHITRFGTCRECHADAHAKQFDARPDKGNCIACHTEQGFAGTTYTMADHERSTFALRGAHRATPCIKCHQDGKVNGKSTKQFHWDSTLQCTVCHADVHKGQFKDRMTNGCETCHTADAWDELKFSHAATKFPLKGKHADIPCIRCHKPVNGVPQYIGLSMRCADCHDDAHAGQFDAGQGTPCERCHSEKQWKALVFDHNSQSKFALTGKHENVKCSKCHKETVINNKRTVKYKPMEATCADCHPAQ
jgi:nitrate/TMAO reductase-like tetraheme cytochrome c subunit